MRILTVTNLYPNPLQPQRATFNRQQLGALASLHPIKVIAPVAWTDELLARTRTGARMPECRRMEQDGICIEHPRYVYPPKVLRHWYGHFYRWSIRKAFATALAEFRPDLVFAPWAYPDGWAAVDLSHRAGLPAVIKIHGSDVLELAAYGGRRQRTIEALRRADGIVAVSHDLARKSIEFGAEPRRIHVLYDGIDSGLFHPGPRDQARKALGLDAAEPLILFIGNLVPVKGIENLIDACARLAADKVRFTCQLIGEGPLRAWLQRRIDRNGLSDRVRLLGIKPHAALPDWFRAANVFVLPSYSEGVPCVLLEALACGTPFVASRVGGIPEIADFGPSQLVPAGDPEALARAIADRLAAPSTNGKKWQGFSRSHAEAAAELAGFLEQVLRGFQLRPAHACPS
jgi:glycosyltransferase involved in cell wall biosynthesis